MERFFSTEGFLNVILWYVMFYVIFLLTIKLERITYNLTLYQFKLLLVDLTVNFFFLTPSTIKNFVFFFLGRVEGGTGWQVPHEILQLDINIS